MDGDGHLGLHTDGSFNTQQYYNYTFFKLFPTVGYYVPSSWCYDRCFQIK